MILGKTLGFLGAIFLPIAGHLFAEPAEVDRLPHLSAKEREISLDDLTGEKVSPLNCGVESKANVLIFSTVDCPIANAFQPTIRRLAERFERGGVRFILVHVDPDVDIEDAKLHAADFEIGIPVVIDATHALVDATGATITPEAVVVVPGGGVAYRGRINDLFTDLGVRRREPRTSELADALEAVLAGKLPEVSVAEAVGCIIADFRRRD